MNKIRLAAVSACISTLCLFGFSSAPSAEEGQSLLQSQPVYDIERAAALHFSRQAHALQQAFSAYCRASENDRNEAPLKQQWHQTMLAWMALQGQERGPREALEKSWNVQFWPDKKNTTGRKMAAITNAEKAMTVGDIAKQSVTVQGLGAIEWLLYDKDSTLAQSLTTCATGEAISENLYNNAMHIANAWDTNPWQAISDDLWLSEYISLLSNQLEYSMKKLSRPLAKMGKPRPYFAESWRSQTSLSNLKANVASLKSLYLAKGKGLDALLRARGDAALADRVLRQFENTLSTWPEEKSLFSALQTKEGYTMVLTQYNKLEQLKFLIHEEVAIELGIVIGFNATDGD